MGVRAQSGHEKRLVEIDQKLQRVGDAIEAAGISDTLAERLKFLESERRQMQQAIDARPHKDILIPDDIPDFGVRWRDLVGSLANLTGRGTDKAREALSGLLGQITLYAVGNHLEAELKLEMKRLALMASPIGSQINSENLVAGAGLPSRLRPPAGFAFGPSGLSCSCR